MKKNTLMHVLEGYKMGLGNSNKDMKRMEKLEILFHIVECKKQNSKTICTEIEDNGLGVVHIANPLNVKNIVTLNLNICNWLEGPDYDMVSY